VLGTEFGDDAGKRALIVRALYGLKSAGAAFRNHLGWHSCRADRDIWMKADTRPDDGVLYWAYILIYVDEILCVHHDPGYPLDKLLPLPQPPVRARTDAQTNPSAQRATQLRSVLARVYAVSIQNQITTTVP
jgi:hypothetical protein